MSDFLPVDQLDFNSLRSNLVQYLQGQDRFKDYNFEGSNMAVLLDIMAYNTYQNAYYLNMIGNEMFLDTATLRDSVVSHAKELNYLPRSYTSGAAVVRTTINVTNAEIFSLTMPEGYKFISTTSDGTFTFTTNQPYIFERNSNNVFVKDISVYEGIVLTEKFIVNNTITKQRYLISNDRVDTDSIEVFISPSTQDISTSEYTFTSSIFGLNSSSQVYFLQAAENGKYEVVFGDGVFGKAPVSGNVVSVRYRVSSGDLSNGINSFSPQGLVSGFSVSVSALSAVAGGAESESVDQIKYNAVRFFQTQDRAVTKEDYKSLILANFPEIRAVSVYGGEEVTPIPQYGRVFISPVTQTGDSITTTTAERLITFLKARSAMTVGPQLIAPEYLNIIVNTEVKYNVNTTSITENGIRNLVLTAINSFNTAQLVDFNKTFRYSKLVTAINAAHNSIITNETSTLMVKSVIPLLSTEFSTTVDFSNAIKKDDDTTSRPTTNEYTLYSSSFTYSGKTAYFGDDGAGNLYVYEFTSTGRSVLKSDGGTVNYDTGVVTISSIILADYEGDGISFFAIPARQDISCNKNTIIRINPTSSQIVVSAINE
jgi:hypothetical protein